MMGYTKGKVHECTGLDLRLIQYYTEEEIVTPEVDKGEGRGKARCYSEKNLLEFSILKPLAMHGIPLGQVKFIFEIIRNEDIWNDVVDETCSHMTIPRDSEGKIDHVNLIPKGDEISNKHINSFDSVLIINLEKIYENLKGI